MAKKSLIDRVKNKNCISGGILPIKNGRFTLSDVNIGITPNELYRKFYKQINICPW